MAQHQVGSTEGLSFTNRVRAVAGSVGVTTPGVGTPANYASIGAMDTRLAAINGSLYTTDYLNRMSMNDKVLALRFHDDNTTL